MNEKLIYFLIRINKIRNLFQNFSVGRNARSAMRERERERERESKRDTINRCTKKEKYKTNKY